MRRAPDHEATRRPPAHGAHPPASRLAKLRTLWTVAAAVILVVIIALIARACATEPGDDSSGLEGPLASIVTGSTDQLTPGEASAAISVLPAAGRVQPSKDQWAQLVPKLRQAVDAAPDDADAQRALALAYYNLGQFSEAKTIYERLLAAGEDPVLRNRLGSTLRDMGDQAGAEAAYRRAIGDDPTQPAPYLNLAELLWRQGHGKDALTVIDQGLQAVAENSRAPLEAGREVLEKAAD